MPPLHPIRSGSLKSQVTTAIREAIFNGEFLLGEPLRELHLARKLQVSQPTVREALLELESQGLVIRTPNIGTTVTNMTTEELRGRLEVRLTLERLAAHKAVQRMSEADLAELERRLQQLVRASSADSHYEAAMADLAFHGWIWRCSGNPVLATTLDHLVAPLFAFISVLRKAGAQQLDWIQLSHAPIVDAFRKRDPALVERELQVHIEGSYGEVLRSGLPDCRTYAERHAPRPGASPVAAGAAARRGISQ